VSLAGPPSPTHSRRRVFNNQRPACTLRRAVGCCARWSRHRPAARGAI